MRTLDTTSYWIDSTSLPSAAKAERNLTVDVIVVGGGITGITAAYLFKKSGKTVALLERDRFASIDTGHTTAHLTSVIDLRLHEVAKTFGKDAARAVWDAGGAAIDQITANIRSLDIACDFKWLPGFLHAATNDKSNVAEELKKEAGLARELGIKADYLNQVPLFGSPGVMFSHQAIFNPRRYLAALLREIPGDGSYVFEHSEVSEFEDEPIAVKIGPVRIQGGYVMIATHTPLTGNTGLASALLFQTKLSLYTSYALSATLPAGSLPEGSYWDTAEAYDYLRVERSGDHDRLIFGGEDHKTGQETDTPSAYHRLEERLRRFAPSAKIGHRWSGQVIETNDGLPFIGETAPHQFAATGFSGNGMTFGTLGAMMAVDSLLGRKNPWQDLFDVHRKKLFGGTWEYLKENKDYPYYMVRDWLGGPDGKSLDELARNEGKILKLDGQKVAAYRDAHGHVSLCSPICTHLQCIVDWNQAEQTWDCPCHGSRFKPTGEVISGPAEEALEKIEPPSSKSGEAS